MAKKLLIFVSVKVRLKSGICSPKPGAFCTRSVKTQAFAGTALYLFLSENIRQTPVISANGRFMDGKADGDRFLGIRKSS